MKTIKVSIAKNKELSKSMPRNFTVVKFSEYDDGDSDEILDPFFKVLKNKKFTHYSASGRNWYAFLIEETERVVEKAVEEYEKKNDKYEYFIEVNPEHDNELSRADWVDEDGKSFDPIDDDYEGSSDSSFQIGSGSKNKYSVIYNGIKMGGNVLLAYAEDSPVLSKYRASRMAAKGGPILIDTKTIPGCDAVLGVLRSQPSFIWVHFIDDVSALETFNKKFPNTVDGYEDARLYYTGKVKMLETKAAGLIAQQKSKLGERQSGYEFNHLVLASGKVIVLNRRSNMRKVVIASSEESPNTRALQNKVLAFESTMRIFNTPDVALAYNMHQTKTRMSKDKIAERVKRHKDRIKQRRDKIKIMEQQKKSAKDNPERVQKLSQRITRQNELIAKHNEALKYYKLIGSIKPPKPKEQPHKHSENKAKKDKKAAAEKPAPAKPAKPASGSKNKK
jgi:hypothetical protein